MPEKNYVVNTDQPKKYVLSLLKKDTSKNHKERVNLEVTRLEQTNKVLISLAPFQHWYSIINYMQIIAKAHNWKQQIKR